MKSSKIAFISLLLASAILLGCRTANVPTGSHSENNTVILKDTCFIHDSIFVERYQNVYIKGDSVIVEREVTKYRDRFRYKTVHDTTLVTKTDTIMVDVPVEKVIENNVVPKWILWSLLFNCLVIVFCVWRIWKRWKH